MNERDVKLSTGFTCSATGGRCVCVERGGRCRASYAKRGTLSKSQRRQLATARIGLASALFWLDAANVESTRAWPNPEIRDAIRKVDAIDDILEGLLK